MLRILKTFVIISATKLENHDVNLASFLLRIEATVHTLSELDRPLDSNLEDGFNFFYLGAIYMTYLSLEQYLKDIRSLVVDVDECANLEEIMEALRDQMVFLQNLIRFIHNPSQHLLAHAEGVAISTAYLLSEYSREALDDQPDEERFRDRILICVEKIKPNDPQVYETYTEALRDSKLSSQEFSSKIWRERPTTNVQISHNQLGYADFVSEKLMELRGVNSVASGSRKCVHIIYDGLVFLRSFMGDVVELRQQREDLQALWDRVLDVTYKMECLVDHLLISNLQDSSSTIDSIMKDIRDIKPKI
ncbi:OLC1v1000815C1 [Oldenlandia corymbosa var. corymbosa]|uniref:OLC1v1000815C1 n=1 Tax=Oldenlandia corymbosa var. corymbosa TaxID=529605 RepID=A0AAV1D450_OLDCO|nr:OLC1v1000815C1 [Oldenlandia corymbosa var. corymbosa]